MAISRKNFRALAGIVSHHRKLHDECTHALHLANAIADHCEEENPNFNRDAFIQACGFHFVDGEGWREGTHRDR